MISPNGYFTIEAILHESYVIFIIGNILFNYFACVTTKNFPGTKYETVVRELAHVTAFDYPETTEEHDHWKMKLYHRLAGRRLVLRDMERHRALSRSNYTNVVANSNNEKSMKGCHNDCCNDNLARQSVQENDANAECTSGRKAPSNDTQARKETLAIKSKAIPNHHSSSTIENRSITKESSLNHSVKTSKAPMSVPQASQDTIPREVMRAIVGPYDWSYCARSRLAKPPRSHFDQVTKSLVLNMDHFCPWMFNVVGYFNYRYFCNFLLYVSLGMTYGAIISFKPFKAIDSALYHRQISKSRALYSSPLQDKFSFRLVRHLYPFVPTPIEKTPVCFTFMICISVGIAVNCLLFFHIYLILTGQTTIEFHTNCYKRQRAKERGGTYRNPYDLGIKQNFEFVWGQCHTFKDFVVAFLPSWREPEFLPMPVEGKLIPRNSKFSPGENIEDPEEIV